MVGLGNGKAQVQVGFLNVHVEAGQTRLELGRLDRPWPSRKRAERVGAEQLAHVALDGPTVHVSDDDQGHVVGVIPALVEVDDALAVERLDGLPKADHWAAVGMAGIGQTKQLCCRARGGRILAALPLFHDDLEFFFQLGRIKARVVHGIGQDIEAGATVARGQHEMVDGMVGRGKGVDVAAGRFNLGRDRADRTPLGALEDHVFVHMGGPGHVGCLVRAAGLDPHLNGHHRGKVILLNGHPQAVLKAKQGTAVVGVGWGRGRGRIVCHAVLCLTSSGASQSRPGWTGEKGAGECEEGDLNPHGCYPTRPST